MRFDIKIFLTTLMIISFTGICTAGETLKDFEGTKGREYHSELYEQNACDSCHEKSDPTDGFPDDFVCLDCHDMEDVVEASARPEDEKWQNPHNNLHYGKDAPCMECHGEHQVREPICNECHNFKYPEHKR